MFFSASGSIRSRWQVWLFAPPRCSWSTGARKSQVPGERSKRKRAKRKSLRAWAPEAFVGYERLSLDKSAKISASTSWPSFSFFAFFVVAFFTAFLVAFLAFLTTALAASFVASVALLIVSVIGSRTDFSSSMSSPQELSKRQR